MDLATASKAELLEISEALKARLNTTNSPKAADALFDFYRRVLAEIDRRHAEETRSRMRRNVIEARARAKRIQTMRSRERGIPVGIPELTLPSKKAYVPSKLSKRAARKARRSTKKRTQIIE